MFLKKFLPFAIIITALCGLVYWTVQQDLRQLANDPQIQMAEDTAVALSHNAMVGDVVPATKIAMDTSLSPFIIVYDDSGKMLASSVQLNGKTPVLPPGVLDMSQWKNAIVGHNLTITTPTNESRFTWQPQDDVRDAVVIVHYSGVRSGYVLVGRSLSEVEKRIEQLSFEVFAAWIAALAATALVLFALEKKHKH